MILYHGSFIEISSPDLRHSRVNVDFGRGFYATPIFEQAEKWSSKFKRRGQEGIVSMYEYFEDATLKILRFDSYSEAWLTFMERHERPLCKEMDVSGVRTYTRPGP